MDKLVEMDYLFEFDDLSDGPGQAHFVNFRTSSETNILVEVDDLDMAFMSQDCMSPVLADSVDLAIAVYVADRLSPGLSTARRIRIVLPVRHPEMLSRASITDKLEEVLHSYTGDKWSFSFRPRGALGRFAERQHSLPSINRFPPPTEVALWSGGLDALAGLYTRMRSPERASSYTLFGTGGNSYIYSVQREVAEAADHQFPASLKRPTRLRQVPIRLASTAHLRKNSVPRARGFVFLLLGAVCAAMEKQDALYLYENGIGAINLPLRPSEVGLDHSRAVHPAQLRLMGHLVSRLFERPFSIRNPYEFWTKAEMCRALVQDGVVCPIFTTVSCDRRRRSTPMQCGCCSSCLLRRQALAVNDVFEAPGTYVALENPALIKRMERFGSAHLGAMLSQVIDIRSDVNSSTPWMSLGGRYSDLIDVAEEVAQHEGWSLGDVENRLVRMFTSYVSEWESVSALISRGFSANLVLDVS